MTSVPSDRPGPPRLVLAGDLSRAAVRDVGRGTTPGIRLRRGAYYLGVGIPSASDHAARRRLDLAQIEAVSRQLPGVHVVSHTSAAMLWGLPLWSRPSAVHVIQQHVPGSRRAQDVVRHRVSLDPSETTVVDGLPVTTRERTVLDCLRTLPARDGLVLADAALRAGVDRRSLHDRLAGAAGRGLVRARAVLDVADRGAESPGESVVRFELLRHGLPAPQTQIPVLTRLGRFRADMGWTEWRLLVEFDGLIKYRELADGDPARVLYEEKRRQEAMEEERWRVLRVTTPDVRDGGALTSRVLRCVPVGTEISPVRRAGLW